jgi:hypothetical protein
VNKLIVEQSGEVICEKYEQDVPPPFMKTKGRVLSYRPMVVLGQLPGKRMTVFDPVYTVLVGKPTRKAKSGR